MKSLGLTRLRRIENDLHEKYLKTRQRFVLNLTRLTSDPG